MKTSNKILLSAFLAVFLLLTGLHAAIYVKYRNGNYVAGTNDLWEAHLASVSLQGVQHVQLKNLQNVSVHASDTARFAYQKEGKESLSMTRNGDTLVLGRDRENWGFVLHVYLTPDMQLSASESNLQLAEPSRPGIQGSLSLLLHNANLAVANQMPASLSPLSRLAITARNSRVSLDRTTIRSLEVDLDMQSELTDGVSNIDSIALRADPEARISLSAKHLTRIKR
ncbi:MAG TPA: hypothetical protein VHK69_13830 [Chitinophagaceae bacterium]|nr:hypothetical protein [Chitinophagaceae bacterium]